MDFYKLYGGFFQIYSVEYLYPLMHLYIRNTFITINKNKNNNP